MWLKLAEVSYFCFAEVEQTLQPLLQVPSHNYSFPTHWHNGYTWTFSKLELQVKLREGQVAVSLHTVICIISSPFENQGQQTGRTCQLMRGWSGWETPQRLVTSICELRGQRSSQFFKQREFVAYLSLSLQSVWAWHCQVENLLFLRAFALVLKNGGARNFRWP